MYRIQPLLHWGLCSVLFLLPLGLSAQCTVPQAPWLSVQQTSNSLSLNWSAVNGANAYELRYWESSAPGDKTVFEAPVVAPYLLTGLRKSTTYRIQIRSVCGSSFSAWGPAVSYVTKSATETCSAPTGVSVVATPGMLQVNWNSSGSHTIRYRAGYTGDWLILSDAMSVSLSPFTISGLSAGAYQVEIKKNCGATSSFFTRFTRVVTAGCPTPAAPVVIPDVTSASVQLTAGNNVLTYNLQYRPGTAGNWITEGVDIPPSLAYLNPPLAPAAQYQVRIQATCTAGISAYSVPTTFATESAATSCLANKNYGKNLSQAQIVQLNSDFNKPSQFTFGSMIGVNDGGLVFRSFQNSIANQITQLTTQFRNFHTTDEDFNNVLLNYDQNIKPKNTFPEGTPAFMGRNKALYNLYRNTHGFTSICAATELLQYGPMSWKDKVYKESDWSMLGPAGIGASFENYTKKFIDELAPANGIGSQMLVSSFQVGNEWWDYPIKSDYHNLLAGARNAFNSKYGLKSLGGWKMNLVVSAFQAYRDNTCTEFLRDVSNCGGDLARHDAIGDYLDVPDCNILKDLGAIDCHPYSFLPGTITWTYPENPMSEAWQIRNMAGWLMVNKNETTGILRDTRLWSSEYGYDSHPTAGVGEKTQSAYLIRGLLLHSRYHYEKVYFYNAYDHARSSDPNYNGLYSSSGFWKLGTDPNNSAWPSPLVAHGAIAKPSWFGMMDLKARFGEHVFYKALVEAADAFVFLLAKPDGTDPYLVFWSPSQTTDATINQNIPISKVVNWSGLLPGNFAIESSMAQTFAESLAVGQNYAAATGMLAGTTTLHTIRRAPAFIRLTTLVANTCPTVVSFKRIPHSNSNCSGNDKYYEVVVSNIAVNDQITLAGLPNNGLNIGQSSLNGVPLTAPVFQANTQYVNNSSLRWLLNAGNGTTQTLQLYYCWAKNYQDVSTTTATSLCSNVVTTCTEASNSNNPEIQERNGQVSAESGAAAAKFRLQPNPGSDQFILTYFGETASQAQLRISSPTGQLMSTIQIPSIEDKQQWQVNTADLPSGLYFIGLQTDSWLRYQTWEKH